MRSMTAAILGVSLLLVSAPVAFANCATDDPDGSKTLAARQQVATDCPCDHGSPPTVNHGQYVKCAANVASTRSGLDPADPNFLPKTCKGAVTKCAAHSTCGKPGFVTCCITTAKGTKCKTKKDAMHCTDKQGVVGSCDSCCDACPAPGSGPSCPAPTTTTTTVASTTTTMPTGPCQCGTPDPTRLQFNTAVGTGNSGMTQFSNGATLINLARGGL